MKYRAYRHGCDAAEFQLRRRGMQAVVQFGEKRVGCGRRRCHGDDKDHCNAE